MLGNQGIFFMGYSCCDKEPRFFSPEGTYYFVASYNAQGDDEELYFNPEP
jgi:hypothetical protein